MGTPPSSFYPAHIESSQIRQALAQAESKM
jgi:hypothetical protein